MKYAELWEGRKVFALVNVTGRTGWDADKSRWVTARVVRPGVSGYPGPVYVTPKRTIEDVVKYKGEYVLVVTIEAEAKGEPSYTKAGNYYLVGLRQVTDFEGYQKRTAAKRAKQEAADAKRTAAYEAGEALDTAWLLATLRKHNASDEAVGLVQQMVNTNELRINRPFNWKPEGSDDSCGDSPQGVD